MDHLWSGANHSRVGRLHHGSVSRLGNCDEANFCFRHRRDRASLPRDIFAKILSRCGLRLNAYNAYQAIIRGGHTFCTIGTDPEKVATSDCSALALPVSITLTRSNQESRLRALHSARFRSPSWLTSAGTRWPRTHLR